MRKLLSLCVLVVLISSSNGYGQSINKEAEEAFEKASFITLDAQSIYVFNSAIINFTKAIKLDPKYTNAYLNRGSTYNELKKYPEAIADFTKAIELDPKYVFAYNGRGAAYSALEKYPEATADYTKAIELDPKYADAYCNRGFAYGIQQKYAEAITDNTKAIELDPSMRLRTTGGALRITP